MFLSEEDADIVNHIHQDNFCPRGPTKFETVNGRQFRIETTPIRWWVSTFLQHRMFDLKEEAENYCREVLRKEAELPIAKLKYEDTELTVILDTEILPIKVRGKWFVFARRIIGHPYGEEEGFLRKVSLRPITDAAKKFLDAI